MNKNIRRAIVFTLGLLLVVVGLQLLADYAYRAKSPNKFSEVMNHKTDEELMVWGSSVAAVHIDPAIMKRKTGMGCYNEGWNGVFYVQYSGVLKEYMAYQKKCKCVIIGCDFETFGKNMYITEPYALLPYLSNNNVYKALHDIEPEKIFRARYVPGYKFALLSKNFYHTFLLGAKAKDTTNGYRPENKTWEGMLKGKELRKLPFLPPIYEDFRATMNSITAKGIEVILVTPPVYHEGYAILEDPAGIVSKYEALPHNNLHIHYLNYSRDSMSLNRSYFYNNYHLNKGGATIFSEKLGDDVKAIMESRK